MGKKLKIYSLILILVLGLSSTTVALKSVNQAKTETKTNISYQTLKGTIHREGTGEFSLLIFKTENGNRYLVKGRHSQTLKKLQGYQLLLTGTINKAKGNYLQGKFIVDDYNTEYPKYIYQIKDIPVLGTIKKINDQVLLITPDQQILELHGIAVKQLADNPGKKSIIRGTLTRKSKYKADMKIKSYLILD